MTTDVKHELSVALRNLARLAGDASLEGEAKKSLAAAYRAAHAVLLRCYEKADGYTIDCDAGE